MNDISLPEPRSLSNTRTINCQGYSREDGLWDIEAHLVDTKPTSVYHPKYGVPKPAGWPLHEMKIRITIDRDMVIRKAEAATLKAPFEQCGVPPQSFSALEGVSLNKGWRKAVEERMGGVAGCTHLRELLGSIATMAYQTIASSPEFIAQMDSGEVEPYFIDSCYTYAADGEVVRQMFPDHVEES